MEKERKVITIGDIFQQCGCCDVGLIYVFVNDFDLHDFIDTGELKNFPPYVIIPLTDMNQNVRRLIFTEDFWNHKVETFYPVKKDVLAVYIEMEY